MQRAMWLFPLIISILLSTGCPVLNLVEGEEDPVEATGVTLNQSSLRLAVGSTTSLDAAVTPSDASSENLSWSSSDSRVLTVDRNGNVTARGAGIATVTVSLADATASSTCGVAVIGGDTIYLKGTVSHCADASDPRFVAWQPPAGFTVGLFT